MRTKNIFTALAALTAAACMTAGLSLLSPVTENKGFNGVYGKTFTAFAEESTAGTTETENAVLYNTKGNKSTDGKYLLLATAIKADVAGYKTVGYEVIKDGGEAVTRPSDTYYTGISVRTSVENEEERTVFTVADIYGDGVTSSAMIVDEIEYSQKSEYKIKPYMIADDEAETVAYGEEITVEWVDTAEEDTGVKKANIFEFEGAEYNGLSQKAPDKCVARSYVFSKDLSGYIGLKNIPQGATFIFTFNSDKNVRVPVSFCFANKTENKKLSDFFSVTVNGYGAADMSAAVPATGIAPDGLNAAYFTMVEAEGTISLEKGKNVVEVTLLVASINPDYMAIKTSAELTGYTPEYWTNGSATVTKSPTETEKGAMQFFCKNDNCTEPTSTSYSLPVLGSDCYEETEQDGVKTYTLTIAGQTVDVTQRYTLTLKGATFSDGASEKRLCAGATEELTCTAPDGKSLVGWVNVDKTTEYYSGSTFTMPAKDITVTPVFETTTYFDKTSAVGKLTPDGKLYGTLTKNCYKVEAKVGVVKKLDGEYELANIYHFKGGDSTNPTDTMPVDSWFLPQSNYGMSSCSIDRTITYTVQNFGSEEVTLRFAPIKRSGDPTTIYNTGAEATVTIKAGETVTFSFDVTYLHNSFMTNIMVKDKAVSEVYIGFFTYITDKA